MNELQNYDPLIEEKKIQDFWEKEKLYEFDKNTKKKIYSVDTPPPTVSGKMHMGHAFSYSQQDFVIRFQRMRGKEVFYPFGTDDNGLPTEKLVEKEKKVKASNMPRQDFVKICLDFLEETKPKFIQSWKDIGMSADFTKSYSTINKHSQKVSQAAFIDLYNKGRIYDLESPNVWCIACQTAIAQAEFESVDLQSNFNDIIFRSGEKELIISTTRPELLPACVALFFNPSDDRYKDLKGKFAQIPIFGYEVPILTDDSVEIEKGTGLMMVCTFGDKEDVAKWHKYSLNLRVVINKDGTLNELAGEFKGLSIKDARKEILERLMKENLLASQKQITHAVNVHERCKTEIEFLKTRQWYIKILDRKQELIDAGNKINWYPKHMKVRYDHWVENLNWDWCISRQRYFGIPIPIWREKDTRNIILPDISQLPVDPTMDKPKNYKGDPSNLIGETDVMDTWATSSVTPQIALNWNDKGDYDIDFENNFPMSLRPQAHDIIRTWLFYTIVRSVCSHDSIPWKDVTIMGHALDPKGRKMSKSLGNIVEPIDMINKYSADALRFWAATSRLGEDLPFQEKDLLTGKKTITKLWNASKFTIMHLGDYDPCQKIHHAHPTDRWLLSKLNRIIKDCTENFENYEYAKTKHEVEKFFWMTFCDQYMEICKDRIYNPDVRGKDERQSAQYALYHTLLSIIKMFAPIMPHVTESIYLSYFAEHEKSKSIHISSWPECSDYLIDEKIEKGGDIIVGIVNAVRKYKSEKQLSLKTDISELVIQIDEPELIEAFLGDLKSVTRAKDIIFGTGDIQTDNAAIKIGIKL